MFLAELGTDATTISSSGSDAPAASPASLFRLSDATGTFTLTVVSSSPPRLTDLSSADIFILDNIGDAVAPAVYAWIGKEASAGERRMGVQFAQKYLREKAEGSPVRASIVKINEGRESEAFLQALEA